MLQPVSGFSVLSRDGSFRVVSVGSFRVIFFRAIIQAHNNLPQRVLAKGGYPRRCLSSSYALLQIHLLLVLVIFWFNYAEFRSVSGVYIPVVQLYVRNVICMHEINAILREIEISGEILSREIVSRH